MTTGYSMGEEELGYTMHVRQFLRKYLSPSMLDILRTIRDLSNKAALMLKRTLKRQSLVDLAVIHKCSKWNPHWYAQHYQKHFSPLRKKHLNIVELGVGGYEDPHSGGKSLRMWKDFFPNSRLYGVDIHTKTLVPEKRIKLFKGDQRDELFLHTLVNEIGGVDIIIDDASHINDYTIKTFEILFPRLNDGGIYVIEDVNNSYWPSHGGDSNDLNNPTTIVNFFKRRVDGLNYKEFIIRGYEPNYYDSHITALHFYHNLVFIYKGRNTENSIRDSCSPDWVAMNNGNNAGHAGVGESVENELAHTPYVDSMVKALNHRGLQRNGRDRLGAVIEINSRPIPEESEGEFSSDRALLVRGRDGTIQYWNKGAERLYGWLPQDTVGKSSHHLLKTVFPKPLTSIETDLSETGRWEGELVHKRRDGSEVRVVSQWELLHDWTQEKSYR